MYCYYYLRECDRFEGSDAQISFWTGFYSSNVLMVTEDFIDYVNCQGHDVSNLLATTGDPK